MTERARPAGSVEADERLRLFFGIPLPDDVSGGLERWAGDALAGGGRVVAREHLHVTLAFLGARPRAELPALARALAEAAGAARVPRLAVSGYRETRSVGMLVLEDEHGRAASLALDLQQRLETLGAYRPERRSWLAHVTVLRFRARPGLRPALPDVPPFSPSDAALYHSVLRPSGAQYRIIDAARLGG